MIYPPGPNCPGTQPTPTEAGVVWMGACCMCMGMRFGVVHHVEPSGEVW